jgi:hypothetical protein
MGRRVIGETPMLRDVTVLSRDSRRFEFRDSVFQPLNEAFGCFTSAAFIQQVLFKFTDPLLKAVANAGANGRRRWFFLLGGGWV